MHLLQHFPKRKATLLVGTVIVFLLSLPLLAMQFTNEVNWSVFDFLVAGTLLSAIGGLFVFISDKKIYSPTTKKVVIAFAIVAFLCIWLELAVGLFNSPIAGN